MKTKTVISTLVIASALSAFAQVTNTTPYGQQPFSGQPANNSRQQPFSGQPAVNGQTRPTAQQYNPYAPPPKVPTLTNNVSGFKNSVPGFGSGVSNRFNVPGGAVPNVPGATSLPNNGANPNNQVVSPNGQNQKLSPNPVVPNQVVPNSVMPNQVAPNQNQVPNQVVPNQNQAPNQVVPNQNQAVPNQGQQAAPFQPAPVNPLAPRAPR